MNWLNVVSVTLTPGLTAQLVSAHARNDRAQAKAAFGAAFIFSAILASLLCGGTYAVFQIAGVSEIFGLDYAGFAAELHQGVTVFSFFIALNILLSVAEAAQSGYQNQYIHNMFLAVGNFFTIALIMLLVRSQPTITNMIVAVYAAPLIARGLSLLQLLMKRRYLLQGMLHLDMKSLRAIAATGSAFILTSFAGFSYQSFSVYWIGHSLGPIAAAKMSVLTTILNVLGSFLVMITQPLWPAIQDAIVRNDTAWVRRAYLRVSKNVMIYVAAAALAVAMGGDVATRVWLKSATPLDRSARLLLGFYFILLAWEHLNYSVLIGLRHYWFAALSYFSGALLMFSSSLWLVAHYGISGMLAAMCLGPLLVTAWIYPLKLRSILMPSRNDSNVVAAGRLW
jgi:O-antigen/teichoic acid export membrane protein